MLQELDITSVSKRYTDTVHAPLQGHQLLERNAYTYRVAHTSSVQVFTDRKRFAYLSPKLWF